MDLIRTSLRALVSRLRRMPGWAAILVGLLVVPLWAVTLGLAGLIHEVVSHFDAWRVRRSSAATPLRPAFRWATTAGIWVLVIALASNASATPTDAGAAAVIGQASPTLTPRPEATAQPAAIEVAVATPTPLPTPTPEPTFRPTGPTTEAAVVRVVDGDTIVVAYGGREYSVRYIGMDTPETKDPNSPVEWMGPEASAANAALVQGRPSSSRGTSPRLTSSIDCSATYG
jgi:hypothetical protein